MAGSSLGERLRVTTFGESHGPALGVVMDGLPGGFAIDLARIQADLDRRKPAQSALVSPRRESDRVEVLSGLFEGRTLGTPLTLLVRNTDADPSSYEHFRDMYRPSHADWTTEARYGHRDWRGGGRASARETAARVAAGAVLRQLLAPIEVLAWVQQIGDLVRPPSDPSDSPSFEEVESNPVRCPDPDLAARMEALIREVRRDGDSVGGVVRGVIRGAPPGLGDPVFDKIEAALAGAMLSIPAARGFEIGSGYASARMRGSAHNDLFEPISPGTPPSVRTLSNHSGGVQGGITNGMPIVFTVAFKPVATIFKDQETVDRAGNRVTLRARGRHDPCVLPRAVPVVEAMALLVLGEHWLRARGNRPETSG